MRKRHSNWFEPFELSTMLPVETELPRAPALYTYYAIMSLLVVVLAISLIWLPFVQLITELNTIIAKVVIYFNVELLGYRNTKFFNALEVVFLSQNSLLMISICCMTYAMYLASGDFLTFTACYICNLPNTKYLQNIKIMAIEVIEYLLNLTGKKRVITTGCLAKKYKDSHA